MENYSMQEGVDKKGDAHRSAEKKLMPDKVCNTHGRALKRRVALALLLALVLPALPGGCAKKGGLPQNKTGEGLASANKNRSGQGDTSDSKDKSGQENASGNGNVSGKETKAGSQKAAPDGAAGSGVDLPDFLREATSVARYVPVRIGQVGADGNARIEGDGAPRVAQSGSESNKGLPGGSPGEAFRLGDIVQDGAMRIVYMASGGYQEEYDYLQPPAGFRYIFFRFCFQNMSEEGDELISLYSFSCHADGREADPFYYASDRQVDAFLSPLRLTTGNVYFCVPEDAQEIDLQYTASRLGAQTMYFAFEKEGDAGYRLPALTRRTQGAIPVGGAAQTERQRLAYLSCEPDESPLDTVQPAPGASFYTLTIDYENLADEDQTATMYDFHCYADGKSCARTYFRDSYLSAEVSPGRKALGTVTFEIPDDALVVEAEYRESGQKGERLYFTVR